jgi:hypothetical protein
MQNGSRFYELTWERNNMNRDELLALAESCCNPAWGDWFSDEDALIQFASLVAAAERQRMEIDSIHTCHAECQRPACVAVREAVKAERETCILMLERLHERSGGQYNYYLHAAKVLKGEV